MNFQKFFAVSFVVVGMPIFSFGIVDFMRGDAGTFITPYLIGGFCLAAIVPAIVLSILLFRAKEESMRFWKIALFSTLAVLVYLPVAGGSQVLTETFAAGVWEKSGEPTGDHGSYREFYPGDSGMAHWPTPWFLIPMWGVLGSVLWLPVLLIGLGLARLLERGVKAIPVRLEVIEN